MSKLNVKSIDLIITELSKSDYASRLLYHDELNQKLWDGITIKEDIRTKIIDDVDIFYKFLDDPLIHVDDIIFTGSNASYNYTPLSDIDVHLLVDFSRLSYAPIADKYFYDKKLLWSVDYNVKIKGYPLEFYVQNSSNSNLVANGVYSLFSNKWLKFPSKIPPLINNTVVNTKVSYYSHLIDNLLSKPYTLDDLDDISQKLYNMRQSGLLHGGEWSVENLTYKLLRSLGYPDKIHAARASLTNSALSLN